MTGDAPAATPFSRGFWWSGAVLLAAGYPSLLRIDVRAENFWSFLAPALILAGYAALGASILTRRDV